MRFGTKLFFSGLILVMAVQVHPREFQLQPMPPQQMERISPEARQQFEMGLNWIDRINLERALDNFVAASNLEPDNVYLRFSVVELARYLGDTRRGSDSIKYYDMAAINLKSIFESPRLNPRERNRANQGLRLLTELRQSVPERDAKRKERGQKLILEIAKEKYQGGGQETDDATSERRQRRDNRQAGAEIPGTQPPAAN